MKCTNCSAEIEADSSFCIVCGKPVAPSGQVRIGRDADCDIILDHERISRLHAVITREGSQYRITDQNSLNGVFVNGARVTSALVQPSDLISLGGIDNLDWNAVSAAFSRSGIYAGPRTSPRPSPVFYQSEPARRKRSPVLLISLIVLGVAGLLAGAYFLFWDDISGGKNQTHRFETEYTYNNKPGEVPEMSARRSRLETMEDLLGKATVELDIDRSLPQAYCLLDFTVGEPQIMQASGSEGEGGKILRTASSSISDKDFKLRWEALQGNSEDMSRIREAETSLVEMKTQVKVAEARLAIASKGKEAKSFVNDLFHLPGDDDFKPLLDSLPVIDNSMEKALKDYESALGAIEGLYESLNSIKTELAEVKAAGKGGRALK